MWSRAIRKVVDAASNARQTTSQWRKVKVKDARTTIKTSAKEWTAQKRSGMQERWKDTRQRVAMWNQRPQWLRLPRISGLFRYFPSFKAVRNTAFGIAFAVAFGFGLGKGLPLAVAEIAKAKINARVEAKGSDREAAVEAQGIGQEAHESTSSFDWKAGFSADDDKKAF